MDFHSRIFFQSQLNLEFVSKAYFVFISNTKIASVAQCMRYCKRLYQYSSGPVFTKGLRLSQVLGLNPFLKLRLLSELSFVLKPYSVRVS